jgi:hypothetical protein
MAVTQSGGPTLGGANLTPTKQVVRSGDADPTGDALSSYSALSPGVLPPSPPTANEPAADFTSVSVGPELDLVDGSQLPNGGFTVTMKVGNLSTASLLDTLARTGSQSLLWVFRFTNGYTDSAASARWNPVQGFTFGYNDYTTGSAPCEPSGPASSDKCLLYPGDAPIQGRVDQATGTIQLSVHRHFLRALSGSTGHLQRPSEVAAQAGSRFYDATAWSLGNTVSPVQNVQSFLYPFDSTPAFDFLLPAGGGGGGGGGAGCKITGGGSIQTGGVEGKFSLSLHASTPPKGNVAYRDPSTDFRSTQIASLSGCGSQRVTASGRGKNGNNDDVDFTLVVEDKGESGTSDTFSLTMNPGGTRSGTLTKGNIQTHN